MEERRREASLNRGRRGQREATQKGLMPLSRRPRRCRCARLAHHALGGFMGKSEENSAFCAAVSGLHGHAQRGPLRGEHAGSSAASTQAATHRA